MHAGGHVACEGPDCHVELTDVRFVRCSLAARGGAKATITGGHAFPAENSPHWLFNVEGTGTTVHASKFSLAGSLAVHGGATFTGKRVHIKLETGSTWGIYAAGDGSRVSMAESCVLLGAEVLASDRRGVGVRDKAEVELTECTVSRMPRGVEVSAGALVKLRDSTVDAAEDGLWVKGEETRVDAAGGRISGRAAAVAIAASVAGRNTQFSQCHIGEHRVFDDFPQQLADPHASADGLHQNSNQVRSQASAFLERCQISMNPCAPSNLTNVMKIQAVESRGEPDRCVTQPNQVRALDCCTRVRQHKVAASAPTFFSET